jgi:hypothetical protein
MEICFNKREREDLQDWIDVGDVCELRSATDDLNDVNEEEDDESELRCMIDLDKKSDVCSTIGWVTRRNEECFTTRGVTREKLKSVRAF